MKLLAFVLIILLNNQVSAKAINGQTYGKKLVLEKSTSVSELLKQPKTLENKHIQVTGKIKKVCPMMGCWLDLQDPQTKQTIKVKVKDGDIVFPKDSVNKTATIEGQLIKKTMSKNKAIKYYKHLAEELGNDFDPKTVTGPVEFWQVQGKGAVIK